MHYTFGGKRESNKMSKKIMHIYFTKLQFELYLLVYTIIEHFYILYVEFGHLVIHHTKSIELESES